MIDAASGSDSYDYAFPNEEKNLPPADEKTAACVTSYFPELLSNPTLWDKVDSPGKKTSLGGNNPHFLWGGASCTLQDSGTNSCPASQWKEWEQKILPPENRSGKSAQFFELYKTTEGRQEIISRLQKLGMNAFRFSIEWSQIEPEEGVFKEEIIQIYTALCHELRAAGIAPVPTLHHFSEPLWFHNKGSFEKEENSIYFVRFAKKLLPLFKQTYAGKPLIEHVFTINEPNIEAFSRYIWASFSPGYYLNFTRAAHFLKGALKAHNLVYHLLKKEVPSLQIGFTHQYLPWRANYFPLTFVANCFNKLLNEATFKVATEGVFELKIPLLCNVREEGLELNVDIIGVQNYVRMALPPPHKAPQTHMPFHEDPEGLYEAIVKLFDVFKKPVMVTENGISTLDDTQRSRFNERALYAAGEAQKIIGEENLKGYFYWSLGDNFEWDRGYTQFFGAYALDKEKGELAGEPKKGMNTYIKATKAWKERCAAPAA